MSLIDRPGRIIGRSAREGNEAAFAAGRYRQAYSINKTFFPQEFTT